VNKSKRTKRKRNIKTKRNNWNSNKSKNLLSPVSMLKNSKTRMKKVKRKRIVRKNQRRVRNPKKAKRKRRRKSRVDLPLSPKVIKYRVTNSLQMKTTKRLKR